MTQHVSRILCAVFFLSWTVVPVLGQGMSAKASGLQPQPAVSADSDRVHDGLVGPVRRVRTEVVRVSNANGKVAEEDKRTLLETAEYDLKGTKTQNQYFPSAGGSLTGREVYKYDDKGNISEMTLLAPDGGLISKEVYKYEYDSVGNWTKMTTSVAVVGDGKINFEPSELTYRTIFYYLDERMAKMLEPNQPSPPSTTVTPGSSDAKAPAGVGGANASTADGSANKSVENSSNRQASSNQTSAVELPNLAMLDKSKISQSQPPPPELRSSSSRTSVVMDSEPPAAIAPKPILKPVSLGVLNGSAVSLPTPTYPDAARRMRILGTVTVEVVIDENGKVISANAVSGPGLLRDVAVQAAYRARFSPTKLSGRPVKVTGTINYKFTLGQ